MEYVFGDITIACSNVDRVVFPEDGITKGEVIAYYHDVAARMVPELRGRPLTVIRYTKGIDRGGFFQKHHQKHFPAWLDRVAAGTKTVVEYPIVDSAAGLVYMANQGAIEFHVWTSRKDAVEHSETGVGDPDGSTGGAGCEVPRGIERSETGAGDPDGSAGAAGCEVPRGINRPDLLVFDLDPPDGRFDLARRAAHLVRGVLDQLGLPAFVKLTGGKGLHVVAPLDDGAMFDEVGELATRIGALLCRRHPDLLTMEFYKKDRRGRLFVDVMRNAIGATLVAPYSLRGRRGAPVSAPIEWSELDDPALCADGLRLRDVRARLDRRGDPWHALRARAGVVSAARRALSALAGGENLAPA